MPSPAIRISNLSKAYRIAHADGFKPTNLGEAVMHRLRNPFRREQVETFWALKDIDLEIERGEVVGVIGRNGAGKSTLLKVLSRITEPTTGRIELFGRVGSLLEVGTGFHPELTGRENIFLNGAILGMRRSEIKRQFDAIVDFAGVEKFLDTPVKRYSSGMYVRLAFAVAAHLNPEILIVDEVLAVGDAEFQKKCLGKMQDVAQSGRTVLFVSHNMSAVEALCSCSIVLRHGGVSFMGKTSEGIQCYNNELKHLALVTELSQRTDRKGNQKARLVLFRVLNSDGSEAPVLQSGRDYHFVMGFYSTADKPLENVAISFDLIDERGVRVMLLRTTFTNQNVTVYPGDTHVTCSVEDLPIAGGVYSVVLYVSHADAEILDWVDAAAVLTIDGGDYFGTGSAGLPNECKNLCRASWASEMGRPLTVLGDRALPSSQC